MGQIAFARAEAEAKEGERLWLTGTVSPSGEVTSAPPPDAFRCKHCGAAVPGAFLLHGEPPQLNVPAMEGHLHRQHLAEWRRLTAKAQSTAQLPAVLAEAFESPLVEPEGR